MIDVLRKFTKGMPVKYLALTTLFTLVFALMNSYLTSALAKVTASSLETGELARASIFFFVFIVLWEVVEFGADYLIAVTEAMIRSSTYSTYYDLLYTAKPRSLINVNTGYVAGIISQLIEKKTSLFVEAVLMMVSVVYVIYLLVYISVSFSWVLGALIFAMAALSIGVRFFGSARLRGRLNRVTTAKAEQTRLFMDSINNISTVQKLRGIGFIRRKSAVCEKENLEAVRSYTTGNEICFCVFKLLNYLICPVCMFAALLLYKRNPSFPISGLMAYLSIVTIQLVHNTRFIASFIQSGNTWEAAQNEMDRIVAEQSDSYTKTSIGTDFNIITLENTCFTYRDDKPASMVRIPSFCVNKGEFVCITGESGQGKTTLLKLLSGILEPEQKLKVDGNPESRNLDAVFIAQDTEMLDMTLRENLCFGNASVTDGELADMLERVGMGLWLKEQPEGLGTLLGERGIFVSTGQRQRLNLIRGLLMEKEIYLLDEPTSNVDEETEEKMVELISERLRGKTVIIVTHRPRVCGICDREYRFENGTMFEVKAER